MALYIPAVPVPEMAIEKDDGTETFRNIPNDDGNRWEIDGKSMGNSRKKTVRDDHRIIVGFLAAWDWSSRSSWDTSV